MPCSFHVRPRANCVAVPRTACWLLSVVASGVPVSIIFLDRSFQSPNIVCRVSRQMASREEVIKEYARLSGQYDTRWRRYTQATVQATLQRLPPLPYQALVVDVACGTGCFAEALSHHPQASRVSKFIGIDISADMIKIATSKAAVKSFGFCSEWYVGAAESVKCVGSGQANLVVTTSSLHYFADPVKFMSEAARVLKESGFLLCSDWCGDYFTSQVLELRLRLTRSPVKRIFKCSELERLVQGARLKLSSSDSELLGCFWGFMFVVAQKGDNFICQSTL